MGKPTLDDAIGRVHRIVDTTAEATLPKAGWSESSFSDEDKGVSPCMDAVGGFTDEVSRYYSVGTRIPDDEDPRRVIEAARDFWERQGFGTVDADALALEGRSEYAIYLRGDGYDFEFLVDLESRVATVGGSTPCLPAPDES